MQSYIISINLRNKESKDEGDSDSGNNNNSNIINFSIGKKDKI